jgi:hypothetical protein
VVDDLARRHGLPANEACLVSAAPIAGFGKADVSITDTSPSISAPIHQQDAR